MLALLPIQSEYGNFSSTVIVWVTIVFITQTLRYFLCPPIVDMAEAFGLVAGAIPLTALVMEQAVKLKRLLGKIKDAPVTTRRLVVELQLLADTLATLDEVYRQESEQATSHLSDHITALCKELLTQLETLLQGLDKGMKNTQTFSWTSLKAAMKIDRIKDLSGQMERALRLLEIINQTTFQEVIRLLPGLIFSN